MLCSLISKPFLTSYYQWDLEINLLEGILRNISLSLLKVIDMISLHLSFLPAVKMVDMFGATAAIV